MYGLSNITAKIKRRGKKHNQWYFIFIWLRRKKKDREKEKEKLILGNKTLKFSLSIFSSFKQTKGNTVYENKCFTW